MRRGSVLDLDKPVWVKPFKNDPLELKVIPSAAMETAGIQFNPTDPGIIRRICERLFVGFRGYVEADGTPVEDTVDTRVELYSRVSDLRGAIALEITRIQSAVAEGNADAASD